MKYQTIYQTSNHNQNKKERKSMNRQRRISPRSSSPISDSNGGINDQTAQQDTGNESLRDIFHVEQKQNDESVEISVSSLQMIEGDSQPDGGDTMMHFSSSSNLSTDRYDAEMNISSSTSLAAVLTSEPGHGGSNQVNNNDDSGTDTSCDLPTVGDSPRSLTSSRPPQADDLPGSISYSNSNTTSVVEDDRFRYLFSYLERKARATIAPQVSKRHPD